MPNWLLAFIIAELEKYVTPDLLKRLEHVAAAAVLCRVKAALATMDDGPAKDGLQVGLGLVADSLGVDLTQCAA